MFKLRERIQGHILQIMIVNSSKIYKLWLHAAGVEIIKIHFLLQLILQEYALQEGNNFVKLKLLSKSISSLS